jgi:hypothetical protein
MTGVFWDTVRVLPRYGLELAVLVALTWMFTCFGVPRRSFVHPLVRGFARLARRRFLCVGLVGVLAGLSSTVVSTFVYHSQPCYHDEFSYVLAADTFAHGRMTNPPHPFWMHFETFHVLQQPTYASKYPPGQGLMLAAGQVIGGSPRVGIWLGMALMGAALCWMLQGWLPPRWALGGALLAVGRLVLASPFLDTFGYWAHSYWGGAVAATGGALLFGALPRLVRQPSVGLAAVFAGALVVLANSRPFEGLVVSLPAAGVLLWILGRRGGVAILRLSLPMLAILVPAGLAMATYNEAVTGEARLMPYVKHEQVYAVAPSFLWQSKRAEPVYNHELMRSFWAGWATESFREQQTVGGLAFHEGIRLVLLWIFFLGVAPGAGVLGLFLARPTGWTALALATCGLLLAALLLEQGTLPHYAAPATGLAAFLLVQGCRRLHAWRPANRPLGRSLVLALLVVTPLDWTMAQLQASRRYDPTAWFQVRARLQEQLEQTSGKHLVLVRYQPDHFTLHEWVYNGADLEEAPVIWAREMGGQRDRALREHYPGRTVWLLEADVQPPRLTPFPAPPPSPLPDGSSNGGNSRRGTIP